MKQHIKHGQVDVLSQVLSYLAVGSLVFLAIGLKNLDNYFDWLAFSITMLVSGFLFAATFYVALGIFVSGTKQYKNANGVGLFAPLAFTFSLTFFGAGRLVNESSVQSKECKEYTIQNMGESGSRPKAYYIFIMNGNKFDRLSIGKSFNKKHRLGDKINLCIMTGRLGFKYYKINASA